MKPGELILTQYYIDMIKNGVNNPIPWIGMPVYFNGEWKKVEGVVEDYAILSGGMTILGSYTFQETSSPHSQFILPGQDISPTEYPTIDYEMGIPAIKIKNWENAECVAGIIDCLWLPKGLSFEQVFCGENNNINISAEELKTLNTDGRTICAKCGGPLKFPIQFWKSMNYCPICEP